MSAIYDDKGNNIKGAKAKLPQEEGKNPGVDLVNDEKAEGKIAFPKNIQIDKVKLLYLKFCVRMNLDIELSFKEINVKPTYEN